MVNNRVIDLMIAEDYKSAAEWMIKLYRPDIFISWDKPRKSNEVKRVASILKTNYGKLQYLREIGYSARDIAEKAYQQTIDDLSSEGLLKNKMKDGKGLHEILNDDQENIS